LAARAKEVKQRRKIYENVIEQEETSQQLKREIQATVAKDVLMKQ
jgi:hypothetical protein